MNNTKWNEIFKVFYNNECEGNNPRVRWRTRDLKLGLSANGMEVGPILDVS